MASLRALGDKKDEQGNLIPPSLNGIDYLEVLDSEAPSEEERQRILKVYFVHGLSTVSGAATLDATNVEILGGVRVANVRVVTVEPLAGNVAEPPADNVLTVMVNEPGDFSTYMLRLVRSSAEPVPPDGFDPRLSEIEFSFKVECSSEFDCAPDASCPEPVWPVPQIDYLAKDYASFRRLMLDRLAMIMPDWQERNPADLGIALIELLAYAADHLSYYQDAAATEAYLGTARKRTSIRRHARLLDYPMHDGCNARAWVAISFEPELPADDGIEIPGPTNNGPGIPLLTTVEETPAALDPQEALAAAGVQVFETMHRLSLYQAHNEIGFYTWGDEECCLPKGATRTTLRGHLPNLGAGNVLIFEEVRGPGSGGPADADPGHRHAVRLTKVSSEDRDGKPLTDPLFEQAITEIEWHPEDALPFPLCLSAVIDDEPVEDISVARGNVVLADHGSTLTGEPLDEVPNAGGYRPTLASGLLTHQGRVRDPEGPLVPYDENAPASATLRWEMRHVLPAIELLEGDQTWRPQRDLLGSDRFASEFVVEMEDDGRARLRFGDGVSGRRPVDGLEATYRIGNGRAGNVGAEAITRLVIDPERFADPQIAARTKRGILKVRNPLPARGGTDPEGTEQVRLHAPQAFRMQERAVTAADYAAAAERHPEVQKAAASRRWSGSWYTWYVTVDRRGGLPVDPNFEDDLRRFLERFRLAGYDLEIEAPRFVSLDIVLTVCVEPGYLRSNVKKALLEDTFSNVQFPGGQRGFFHPDNFTFGQPVYLSRLVATAMQVPGVSWVDPVRFQRWGEVSRGELKAGRLTFDRLETPRLENDPNAPENGKIELDMRGGL